MSIINKKIKLDTRQEIILNEFILSFLPSIDKPRKSEGNEITYIHATLDRVFIQNFGFNLSQDSIVQAFRQLDYDFSFKKAEWDPEKKIIKPTKNISLRRSEKRIIKIKSNFLYINVKADTVRFLRKSTSSLPASTNLDKFAKTQYLLKSLNAFKETIE